MDAGTGRDGHAEDESHGPCSTWVKLVFVYVRILLCQLLALQAGRTAAVYGPILCFRVEGVAFGLAALLLMRLALHGAGTKKPGGRQHPRSRAVNR